MYGLIIAVIAFGVASVVPDSVAATNQNTPVMDY
jgi:hypothetical protein